MDATATAARPGVCRSPGIHDAYTLDYAYLVRDRDGSTRREQPSRRGLFSRERWLRALSDAGFEPRVVLFNHSELEPGRYEVFVAVRSA